MFYSSYTGVILQTSAISHVFFFAQFIHVVFMSYVDPLKVTSLDFFFLSVPLNELINKFKRKKFLKKKQQQFFIYFCIYIFLQSCFETQMRKYANAQIKENWIV